MKFTITTEQEVDGRWLAVVEEIPGCMTYGDGQSEAVSLAISLAVEVLRDRLIEAAERLYSKRPPRLRLLDGGQNNSYFPSSGLDEPKGRQ